MGERKTGSLHNLFCKLLSALLCAALLAGSVEPAIMQVSAGELQAEIGSANSVEDEAEEGNNDSNSGGETSGAGNSGDNADGQTSGAGDNGDNAGGQASEAGDNGDSAGGQASEAGDNEDNAGGQASGAGDNGDNTGGQTSGAGDNGDNAGEDTSGEDIDGENSDIQAPDADMDEEDSDEAVPDESDDVEEPEDWQIEYAVPEHIEFAADDIASGYGNGGYLAWCINRSGKLTVEGYGDFDRDAVSTGNRPRWYDYRERIKSAEVYMSGMTDLSYMFASCDSLTSVTFIGFDTSYVSNMRYMFSGCYSLTSLDLSCFDTANVTNMTYMFSGCSRLKTLDLSSFNTANVTDMSSMFSGCSGLGTLNLSSFDTSNVTTMASMFLNCRTLKKLELSKFNTSNVTTMSSMFSGCAGLTNLDLSNFNTKKVTNMIYMFRDCIGMQALDVSKFNTEKVVSMCGMFYNCAALQTLDLSSFNTVSVYDMSYMFYKCQSLKSLDLSNFDTGNINTPYANAGGMSNMFAYCSSLEMLDLSTFKTESVINMSHMFMECRSLKSLDVRNFDTQKVTNMDLMFYNCESLIELDISNFITGNVANMKYMFSGCRSLEKLSLDNFVTDKVTDMGYMFNNCNSLPALDLSNFNTSNVLYMIGMFSGCNSLQELDLSCFDTSAVTLMSYMFHNCSSLTNLDISNFTTSNVQYQPYVPYPVVNPAPNYGGMEYMFNNCNNLPSLDVSSFETGNVMYMNNMFSGCGGITELKLDADKFKTGQVTTMASMFSGCNRLLDLDVSGFDTANVTNMSSMFKGCNSLGSVDDDNGEAGSAAEVKFNVGNFDTSNVTDMSEMFSRCNSLINLDVSNFDTGSVTSMNGMFFLCINLEELDLKHFNTVNVSDMHDMFYSCRALTELDLSSFDAASAEDVWCMLSECSGLKVIHTPVNLALTAVLPKGEPEDEWYQSGKYNNIITTLPQNMDHSIMLIKNKEFEYPCIIIQKTKTVYNRGEELDTDDLTVTYYDIEGNPTVIEDGYTTNADEIDMRKSDTAVLKVTYVKDEQEFSDTVDLTITGKMKVKISGIDIDNMTYNAEPAAYYGQLEVTLEMDGTTLPYSEVNLMFGYGGRLADGTVYPYTDSGKPPVDAGVYYMRVSVAEDNEYYIGDIVIPFDIYPAPVTITADDVLITAGTQLPDTYTYKAEGLFKEETLDVEPVFACDADINKVGMYYIVPSGADAGTNYTINYENGVMTITGKKFVEISGITTNNTLYNTKPYSYKGEAVVKLANGEDVTEDVGRLIYSYSGILADGHTLYGGSSAAPVDAGTYTLTVAVPEDNESYSGSREYSFIISKMPVQITAKSITLYTGDALPSVYEYDVSGLLYNKTLDVEPIVTCEVSNTSKEGIYMIVPSGADAGYNYDIIYSNGILTIKYGNFTVEEIPHQIFTGKKIIPEVRVYASDGETLLNAKKDYTVKYYNNINADTPKESLRQTLPNRDGSADEGFTKGMAYVVVKGKGNYKGTVYRNFYIDPVEISQDKVTEAEGFKLKYKEQLITGKKAQKPFQSIKYKTSMKADRDYTLKLTALEAYNGQGEELKKGETVSEGAAMAVPANYYGTFNMTIKGIDNYAKTITKTIYVSDKEHLIKNAKISLGKNLKKAAYADGGGVILTPAYYDLAGRTYYVTDEDGARSTADKNDVFTVKAGNKYLEYGEDFDVIYKNNDRVGTATMTIVGKGGYMGTKSVKFNIKGRDFNDKTITVNNFSLSMRYNGEGRTQDNAELTSNAETGEDGAKKLTLNEDYSVTYKNNLNKGTATAIFTGKAEAGYKGSFKKTYQIEAADLSEDVTVIAADKNDTIKMNQKNEYHFNGKVNYTKEGTKPSDRIRLVMGEGKDKITLAEGRDYNISYQGIDKPGTSAMLITGMDNYSGDIKVTFDISAVELKDSGTLSVTAEALPYNVKNDPGYKYISKIRVMDGKRVLAENQDYTVEQHRTSQEEVEAYIQAKAAGASTADLYKLKPYAVIKAVEGSGYTGNIETDLNIYSAKLKKNNLYVVIPDEDINTVYTGQQLKPEIEVYYGDAKAVKEAAKAEMTNSATLTDPEGEYKFIKLKLRAGQNCGDYTLSYGDNVKVGKNKGRIIINGSGFYGGKVTFKFTIRGKDVYDSKVEPWSIIKDKVKAVFAR